MGLLSRRENEEPEGFTIDLDLDDDPSDELDGDDADDCPALDDEREQVGYELFDWDATRLDMLDDRLHAAALPHEWLAEGYELVVHADDEEVVDELVAASQSPHELEPDDAEPGEGETDAAVLGRLFVAADRMVRRPFAPEAVHALLDAAEGMEALPPYGVEDEVWAYVGARVDHLLELVDEREEETEAAEQARLLREVLRPLA